ncbi:esterase-like activity of phytase family protein [Solimonas sp. K1W22B-7]|uniref:esterase-like activity of phytase family protein n=1 Tax=Solimonas sp. K1W22B-7 TaxID=2303331 RepID=UPI0013C51699|nr:esterase-like activity of phytase family protein [Solimonas sp. K1W22B-7]
MAHALAGLLLLGGALAAARAADPAGSFELLTRIGDVELPELSGLAASRRWPGIYWAHNDSGGAPRLFAFNRRGEVIARVDVEGAEAIDWEDIALYERDGRSWLAIGDIGDNLAWRSTVTVYLVPEPELDASRVAVQRRIEFRYPGGPRDAEGLAVDGEGGRILVAEKGFAPAGLYSLPLDAGEGVQTAERVASLNLAFAKAAAPAEPLSAARNRVSLTAMDLDRDGRHLAMISYGWLFCFDRAAGESWAQAVARPPRSWRLPRAGGLEAMAIEPDGVSVVVAPEGLPAPVYRARRILAP